MKGIKNIVGPNIKKIRKEQGYSQKALSAKLQIEGLTDITENVVTKIEGQLRNVTDYEAHIIASILNVNIDALFPEYSYTSEIIEQIRRPQRSKLH